MNWIICALLSAFFAGLTATLAKCGVKGINSDIATAVRTTVVLFLVWGIVFFNGVFSQVKTLSKTNIAFLVFSGVATGLSWIFYFKALQLADVSKVAPVDKLSVVFAIALGMIFLHEKVSLTTLFGALLITAGSIVILFGK